ncbi:MAG: DUF4160 domain-containing protein [Eubacteriales bacterium]|nr:DUF4160 domain-containing protein [Eubacteriales bacterium]
MSTYCRKVVFQVGPYYSPSNLKLIAERLFSYEENYTIYDLINFFLSDIDTYKEQHLVGLHYDFNIEDLYIFDGTRYRNLWDACAKIETLFNYLHLGDTIILALQPESHGGGASVGTLDGITFYFNSNESNHLYTPHVHACYGEYEISIGLKPILILAGRFPSRSKKQKALKYIHKHQLELLQGWRDMTNGISVNRELWPI